MEAPPTERKLASRKFGMAAFVLVSALGLLIFKYIDAVTWMQANYTVLGLYITGNVAEKVFTK